MACLAPGQVHGSRLQYDRTYHQTLADSRVALVRRHPLVDEAIFRRDSFQEYRYAHAPHALSHPMGLCHHCCGQYDPPNLTHQEAYVGMSRADWTSLLYFNSKHYRRVKLKPVPPMDPSYGGADVWTVPLRSHTGEDTCIAALMRRPSHRDLVVAACRCL